MRAILTSLLLLMSLYGNATSSCQLLINGPNYLDHSIGSIKFATFNSSFIWLDASMGDRTASFNTNMDYEVVTGAGSYYFRLNGEAYNPTGTNQTYIYDLAWAFNMVPPAAGTYVVNAYNSTQNPVFYRYIDTIGDSITWWQQGRFFRCLMRDSGLHYDFKGTQTDVFGFNHDGEGGDTTTDVLARMASIPVSDAYFVLIGTNDHTTAAATATNIATISTQLSVKNPCAKIYISTLLPRNDTYNTLNQSINALLLSHGSFCNNCTVIDTGGYLYSQSNWATYLDAGGIHPTYAGYQLLAAYLAPLLI